MTGDGDGSPATPTRTRLPRPQTDRSTEIPPSALPGDGTLERREARRDTQIRRWDIVTPSATKIGRASDPMADIDENLRRLHDEQHPAMTGHSERMHRLDKARITHALCNTLDLTPWERDRVLGLMAELDLTAFGSQRAIPKVALVTIQHVVDRERMTKLGLQDTEWLADQTPETLESLYEQFTSIKDEQHYQRLLEEHDLDTTSVNRLNRVLETEIEKRDLEGAVFGRSPYRDPNLPAFDDRKESSGEPATSD
ncbi:MAG: DNA-directed RNA polymerase subunit epsilon [Halobacteriales archaeon]|nr:DNA-directed RNA polymerase subunit epsilon [Halobacteriales archaeon]